MNTYLKDNLFVSNVSVSRQCFGVAGISAAGVIIILHCSDHTAAQSCGIDDINMFKQWWNSD